MKQPVKTFGDTARGLARNPLGIIALFIVLVYGFASLVTLFAGSFSATERLPLIWFLVLFPVLVLVVFAWLVSLHSGKLFAPSDFRNEDNYVRMQMSAAASLATAVAERGKNGSSADVQEIVNVVRQAPLTRGSAKRSQQPHLLWVDDLPENNTHERRAFEALGVDVTLALSTDDALKQASRREFAAIISDMARPEGPREGYALLDALRRSGDKTPFYIYSSSNAPEHKLEAAKHGSQGCTNDPQELFRMVTREIGPRDS